MKDKKIENQGRVITDICPICNRILINPNYCHTCRQKVSPKKII